MTYAAHASAPAGLELNLNLNTHRGDLYIREQREGEAGGKQTNRNREGEKKGDRNGLKLHSYFIPQSNTDRQAAR